VSFAELFPGCAVRWEDDRPFEVEVLAPLAREPSTVPRISMLLLRHGWRVRLAQFGRDGAHAYALVVEAAPADLAPGPKIPA
jgi:hypothetical protein